MGVLTISLLGILSLATYATSHICAGTVWESTAYGSHTPQGEEHCIRVTLESTEDSDNSMFDVYTIMDNDPTSNRKLATIRTEGDKIYFRRDNAPEEWLLMYDFGLQPGESCTVWSIPYFENNKPFPTQVKCTEIFASYEYGGVTAMKLEETYGEEPRPVSHGIWLKGISSANGFLSNNRFELDGGTEILQKVTTASGIVICERTESGIAHATYSGKESVSVTGTTISIRDMPVPTVITLCDISGKTIYQSRTSTADHTITLPESGIYILNTETESYKIQTR